MSYADKDGTPTERAIRPLSIVFMEEKLVLLAHCLLRDDYRAFRVDRIKSILPTETSFKPHRVAMLREYLEQIKAETQRFIGKSPHSNR
jgi:predicted DNA-binding transcriptional regulator YafY